MLLLEAALQFLSVERVCRADGETSNRKEKEAVPILPLEPKAISSHLGMLNIRSATNV